MWAGDRSAASQEGSALPPYASKLGRGTGRRPGSGWQMRGRVSKRDELSFVEPQELGRRFVELGLKPALRPRTEGSKTYELDPAIFVSRPPSGEAPLLETVDQPRRGGRVAAPFRGERLHGLTLAGREAA